MIELKIITLLKKMAEVHKKNSLHIYLFYEKIRGNFKKLNIIA
jgi:hypothetical protein